VLAVPLEVLDDVVQQVRALRAHAEVHGDVREVRVEVVKLRRVVHEASQSVMRHAVRLGGDQTASPQHRAQHRQVLAAQVAQTAHVAPVTQT
jgi:hypothetical protein